MVSLYSTARTLVPSSMAEQITTDTWKRQRKYKINRKRKKYKFVCIGEHA